MAAQQRLWDFLDEPEVASTPANTCGPQKLKTCTKCGILQGLEQFARSSSGKDGCSTRCKSCAAAYLKEWERKKKERLDKAVGQNENQLRKCDGCGTIQPICNFSLNVRGREGRHSLCGACKCAKGADKRADVRRGVRPSIDEANNFKICRKCGQLQPLSNFYRRPDSLTAYYSRCRGCVGIESRRQVEKDPIYQHNRQSKWYRENQEKKRESHKKWIAEHPGYYKKEQQDRHLWEFGVDLGWYKQTLAAQNGRCAICGSPVPGGQGRFHVDHDHRCCGSRKACEKCRRGLLCSSCNLKLGNLENLKWKRQAIAYLNKYRGNAVVDDGQGSLFG